MSVGSSGLSDLEMVGMVGKSEISGAFHWHFIAILAIGPSTEHPVFLYLRVHHAELS